MKKIKFRGKRVDNGEWVCGNGIHYPKSINYKGRCFIDGMQNRANDWLEVDHETICQYTGKDDCDGKPMFEGDIVKTNLRHIQTIQWSDDYCAFVCVEIGYDKPCQVDILDEVIGNIYDNPELLEVSK